MNPLICVKVGSIRSQSRGKTMTISFFAILSCYGLISSRLFSLRYYSRIHLHDATLQTQDEMLVNAILTNTTKSIATAIPSNTTAIANLNKTPSDVLVDSISSTESSLPQTNDTTNKTRLLMGIFSADFYHENRYRNAFRELLQSHPKVCSLHDFMIKQENVNGDSTYNNNPCELIYTFVLGGNPNGPTEIVSTIQNDNTNISILAPQPPSEPKFSTDFNETDMLFLNIRENLKNGKSQTWLAYAITEMEKYNINYVMKTDTDTMIYLDRYFDFVNHWLPPKPYNQPIIAGKIVDKTVWDTTEDEQTVKDVLSKRAKYRWLRFWPAGEMYILSHDVAQGVVTIAANDPKVRKFMAGLEDHDISLMAFASLDKPQNSIKVITSDIQFWLHPLKLKFKIGAWKKIWDEEINRIRILFPHYNRHTINQSSNSSSIEPVHNQNNNDNDDNKLADTIPKDTLGKELSADFIDRMRYEWSEKINQFNLTQLSDQIAKSQNVIIVDNTIATNEACFMANGQLEQTLQVVEFTADGGSYWSEFANIIKRNSPGGADVIILNEMDIRTTQDGNMVHTTQQLAQELSMNYVWAMEYIDLHNFDNNVTNNFPRFSGQAILSKCTLYDPFVIRDKQEYDQLSNSKQLGGKIGLFARTGNSNAVTGHANHIVVGSLHEMTTQSHKRAVWEYQFDGYADSLQLGIPRRNQIGSILAGKINRSVCREFGLWNLDRNKRRKTWPASCGDKPTLGRTRSDYFCGNLHVSIEDSAYLPCHNPEKNDQQQQQQQQLSSIQISTHSIISISLR